MKILSAKTYNKLVEDSINLPIAQKELSLARNKIKSLVLENAKLKTEGLFRDPKGRYTVRKVVDVNEF